MRRIVSFTNMSLDGLIELMEEWHFDYIDDETTKIAEQQLSTCDALILGRRTYDAFAETWPARTGAIAEKLNSMKKYVASTTLDKADWNNSTLIRGNLVEEVAKIKQQPGQDILMYGFGPVAQTLLQHGLFDDLHVAVHPVLTGVGGLGEMLFRPGNAARLELTGTHALASGVVVLSYRATPATSAT